MPDFPPLHADLSFNSPLSDARASQLIAELGNLGSAQIVDVGCGWAELLLRVLEANPNAGGIGIDTNSEALAHGRSNASARGLDTRVRLINTDAAESFPAVPNLVMCIGSSHVWGGHAAALEAIRGHVSSGSQVLLGESTWSRTPTPRALTALGATAGDMPSLPELVAAVGPLGFRPLSVAEATQSEWDDFESGYSRGYERWLIAHKPSDADYDKVLLLADEHRKAYLDGYRGIFGFAYLHLVAV
ncbi:MAG: Methyltransferase type 12 [Aeromicrobium sp.]|nr:Methyltransferase type 12 [Aeromicrobium sp.]